MERLKDLVALRAVPEKDLIVAQQEQSLLDAGADADAAGLLDAIKGRAAERLTACMGGPAVRCAR